MQVIIFVSEAISKALRGLIEANILWLLISILRFYEI